MSDDQSDGTIIAVANHLLEQKKCREWKKYAPKKRGWCFFWRG